MSELQTFDAMHKICNDSGQPCYWDRKYKDWLIAAGQHRDSDILERTNWESFIEALDEIENDDVYVIERENHWGAGWVEHLLVNPDNKQAIEVTKELLKRLEDYLILDEEKLSSNEYEEYQEAWQNNGQEDYRTFLGSKYQMKGYYIIANTIYNLDSKNTEVLADKAKQMVDYEYEFDSDGCNINIEGLVECTDDSDVIRVVMSNRPKHSVTLTIPPSYPYDPKQTKLFDV